MVRSAAVPHHRHAEEILREAFRDGRGIGFLDLDVRGAFLALRPVDGNEGAKGDQILVTFPDAFNLEHWAIEEESLSVWEWCVPARLVNAQATVRLLTEDEVDAL